MWNSTSLKVTKAYLALLGRCGVMVKCWFPALMLCFVFIVDLNPELLIDLQVKGKGNIDVDVLCFILKQEGWQTSEQMWNFMRRFSYYATEK